MRALLLLSLLAGCSLITTHASSSAPSSPPDDRAVANGEDDGEKLFINRDQFHSLKGLTIEQAKAKAKSYGHDGKVKVEEMDEFVEGCKAGTVCTATDERGGQSGMSIHEDLLLQINKSLSIAPPPEEN